jgi:hypothetical protein
MVSLQEQRPTLTQFCLLTETRKLCDRTFEGLTLTTNRVTARAQRTNGRVRPHICGRPSDQKFSLIFDRTWFVLASLYPIDDRGLPQQRWPP